MCNSKTDFLDGSNSALVKEVCFFVDAYLEASENTRFEGMLAPPKLSRLKLTY